MSSIQLIVSRRQAIIAFLLATMFFFYAFMQRVSPSVMTSELMRDFQVGGAALGSLSAFYFYAYASIQLPVGLLTDYFGPRKLMSFAAALCAIASVGLAFSDSLVSASIARAFIGATVAFGFVGAMAIAGYWFKPTQYALLAGLLQTAGMSGGIFGQAPLRLLVESIGWRGTILILAALALLLAVMLFTLIPRRPQHVLAKNAADESHSPSLLKSVSKGLALVAGNAQTWICAAIGFGMASIMLGFGALWGVPWLHSVHGYSTTEAALITSMLFVGWAVLSPFCGWFSDRIGRRNSVLRCGILIALVAFGWLIFYTPKSTSLLMLLIFFTGAGGSAMTVAFSSVKELNPIQASSTSLGLMNMFIVGAGAVMQPLVGWILDQSWTGLIIDGARIYSADNYRQAFASLLVVTVMALLVSLFLKETHCKQHK